MADNEKFIGKAIKHPGRLRRSAEQHHAITKAGTIDLPKMDRIAKEEGNTELEREVNLAKELRSIRKEKERPAWDVNYDSPPSRSPRHMRFQRRSHAEAHSRGHHGGPCDTSCRRGGRPHSHRR